MNVSEIRWRQPMFGPDGSKHTFKVDDRVRIARVADSMTTRTIIGHSGIVVETDDISPTSVKVRCSTCRSLHFMHEQELDFFGDDLVQTLQEKAGIPDDTVVIDRSNDNLEDFLAVAMHRAGFERISIQGKPSPACDPRLPRPVWSKYAFGVITRMASFRVYHEALVKLAHEAGGYLAEWASFSHNRGYSVVIGEDDLDTSTIDMPIRALIVAKSTTAMDEYDEIKDMVAFWLQDRHQIDVGAIYRASRDLGFTIGKWEWDDRGSEYTLRLGWKKNDGEGWATFVAWAADHWDWVGTFHVFIDDEGDHDIHRLNRLEKKDASARVEIIEDEDAPF